MKVPLETEGLFLWVLIFSSVSALANFVHKLMVCGENFT